MGVVFVFGNEDYAQDNSALKVAALLKGKYTFMFSARPESLLQISDNHIIILDAARGISEVGLIGIDKLKNAPKTSLHDFDLGFFLKLISKIDKKKKFTIIGVPQTGDINAYSLEVDNLLKKII